MKVLFVFNHPAPYKVKYFNELAKYVDLTVIFERKAARDRNAKFYEGNVYNFKHIFLESGDFGRENHNSGEIIEHLKENRYDFVIMNGYSTFTEMRTINYMNKHRIKYILFINGGIKKEKESSLRRNLKKKYIGGAEYYFSPNEISNEYLEFYGANKETIFNYPYSSINESEKVTKVNRRAYREELGLPLDKHIIISCGQFIKRKNYMTLLKQWKLMDQTMELILIGGGPLSNKYRRYIKMKKMKNVRIIDYLEKDMLFKYFRAADIFVFPSLEDINGHVINEAMSQGLPVISGTGTTSSVHLIKNAKNGYLYDPDDFESLRDDIFNILDRHDHFTRNAIETVKDNTVEKMAEITFHQLESVYKKPKVIYLTSSMDEHEYSRLLRNTMFPPNPSNQNFHSRYIELLSKYYDDISVISLRPFNKKIYPYKNELDRSIKVFDNVEYVYLEVGLKQSRSMKYKAIYNAIDARYKDSRTIILVDPLNLSLAKAAYDFKKKYNALTVAFLTDNPKNISGTSWLFSQLHKKYVKQHDGYIALTESLNKLFNVNNKPHIQIEGVSEDFIKYDSPQVSEYFFFGGALYEKYGVMDLINAFKEIDNKEYIDLVIAGHGPLSEQIEYIATKNRHIKFVATISKEEMAQYEQYAIACINPRRKDPKLDSESIPSKVIEYASNKSLIISTYNDKLYDIFEDNIIYYHNPDELKDVLHNVLKTREDKIYKKNVDSNYKVIKENYSEDVIVNKLSDFFNELLRQTK